MKNLLVIGAALKVLGVSLTALVLLTPILVIGHIVLGWMWIRWGWYKQQQETWLIDKWTPLQVAQAHWQIRILKALGIPPNGFNPRILPEEYERILASVEGGPIGDQHPE